MRLIGWLDVLLADRTDKAAFSSEALGRGGGQLTRNRERETEDTEGFNVQHKQRKEIQLFYSFNHLHVH